VADETRAGLGAPPHRCSHRVRVCFERNKVDLAEEITGKTLLSSTHLIVTSCTPSPN